MLFGWLKERAAIKLSERLDGLEDAMRTLSSHEKARDLEFSELYEKVQRLYGRIARRASRMNESTQGETGAPADNDVNQPHQPAASPALQHALREIAVRRGLG